MDFKLELRQLVDQLKKDLGKTQEQISVDAGYEPQGLTQALSKKSGHEAVLKQLKIAYKSVLEKSTNGRGTDKTFHETLRDFKMNPRFTPIPIYDVDIAAGSGELTSDKPEDIQGYYYIPEFSDCRAFNVYGNSMEPLIPKGARMFCKKLDYWRDYLELGQIYAVGMVGGERYLKYIRDETETHFILGSENEDYKDFKVPKKLVRSIWVIEGWLNKHTQNTFFVLNLDENNRRVK